MLLLLSSALAGRLVEVEYQEGRILDFAFSSSGMEFTAEVRDVCHFWIQNLWYFEREEEWERPCSDWRPMTDQDPVRRLMAQPRDGKRPIRGPDVSGPHVVAVDITRPHSLRGSVWGAVFQDGAWRVAADGLGAALVLGDLVGETVDRLNLRVVADAVVDTHRDDDIEPVVPVKWHVKNRPELVDDSTVKMDEGVLELVGEDWRCQGLTALYPADFVALTDSLRDQVSYLAERSESCPSAVKAQAPFVCEGAYERVVNSRGAEGLARTFRQVEPIYDHCGPKYTTAVQEKVAALYAEAFSRGRLDDADDLVTTYGDVMGEPWATESRAQVDVMITETIPNRFDWAVQNKAKGQALELIERYGPTLGDQWTAQATRRAERLK